jgi:hypothetical protein
MESFLKTLRGKAYFVKFLPNNFIFSQEMLQLIGTTNNDFSHECLSFKCIVQEYKYSHTASSLLPITNNY